MSEGEQRTRGAPKRGGGEGVRKAFGQNWVRAGATGSYQSSLARGARAVAQCC